MSIPRLLLLGETFIIALVITCISRPVSLKWWGLFCLLIVSLLLAIPKSLYTRQLFVAIMELPETFFNMFLNLFRLKGANKKFIHTEHGRTA